MAGRRSISLRTKLASALLQMLRPDDAGKLVPIIPYEDAKLMSDEQIISLFHFDHGILHAHEGPDEAWNLTPRPILEHRTKTAKIDTPRAAKVVRHQRANDDAVNRLLARDRGERPAPSKWPKRKMQSRGFDQSARRS